jgi:pre-rRNA-processing protein TSR1
VLHIGTASCCVVLYAVSCCAPRGLKSFRSSPWDAREGLPAEYGRVFAFENFKRTAKRAREAAVSKTCGQEMSGCQHLSFIWMAVMSSPAKA